MRALLLSACVVWGTACTEPPTQVVVRVATDMRAPDDLDALRIRVLDGVGRIRREEIVRDIRLPDDGRYAIVGTFGVRPEGRDASRRFEVRAAPLASGAERFETRAISGFVTRRTVQLDLYVPGMCVALAELCTPDETCGVTGCVDPEIPAAELPRASNEPIGETPDDRRGGGSDAGPSEDAGGVDGGVPDAGSVAPCEVVATAGVSSGSVGGVSIAAAAAAGEDALVVAGDYVGPGQLFEGGPALPFTSPDLINVFVAFVAGPTLTPIDGLGLPGTGPQRVVDAGGDAAGRAYVLGHNQGTLPLGAATHVAAGDDSGVFLFAVDSGADGLEVIWSVELDGPGGDEAADLVVEPDGTSWAVGWFAGELDGTPAAGMLDAWVARTSAGGVTAVATLGSPGAITRYHAAARVADALWVVGTVFAGPLDVGGERFGAPAVFLVELGPDLVVRRALRVDLVLTATSQIAGLVPLGDGSFWLGGSYSGTGTFGGVEGTALGGADAFLFRAGPDGRMRSSNRFGTAFGERIDELALGPDGGLVFGGQFTASLDVGGTVSGPAGMSSAFVARLTPVGNPCWAVSLASDAGLSGVSAVLPSSGRLVVTGAFTGTISLDRVRVDAEPGTNDGFVIALSEGG